MSTEPSHKPSSLPLYGPIPKIERQRSHHRFLWAVRPPAVMVDLIHASRIVMYEEPFFPPETQVILTSTISDAALAEFSFVDELQIINKLEPDYVIPFDFPVYGDMDAEEREENIRQILQGTIDMDYLFGELSPGEINQVVDETEIPKECLSESKGPVVIPLIKGATKEEREQFYSVIKTLNPPFIAKYGVQYMTIGGGGGYPALRRDIETIEDEFDGYPLIVIGLLSPSGKYSLEGLPDSVIGGAGLNQWVNRIAPKSRRTSEMQNRYEEFTKAVCKGVSLPANYSAQFGPDGGSTRPKLEINRGVSVGDDLTPSLSGASEEGGYGFGERKRDPGAMGPAEAGKIGGKQPAPSRNTTQEDQTGDSNG